VSVGLRCDECASAYWGNPRAINGICRRCECSGNVDPLDPGACDAATGVCTGCLYDTAGPHCERCKDFYYGSAADRTCIGKAINSFFFLIIYQFCFKLDVMKVGKRFCSLTYSRQFLNLLKQLTFNYAFSEIVLPKQIFISPSRKTSLVKRKRCVHSGHFSDKGEEGLFSCERPNIFCKKFLDCLKSTVCLHIKKVHFCLGPWCQPITILFGEH